MSLILVAAQVLAIAAPIVHSNPDWLKRPTSDEIRALWPADALAKRISGKVSLTCIVNVHGLLERCRVADEAPANMGFGEAALLLTPSFLMKPASNDSVPAPSEVRIPINFIAGAGGLEGPGLVYREMLTAPVWTSAATFSDLKAVYPASARNAAGYVSLRCEVRHDGTLKNCDVTRENPPNLGFGRAAKQLSAKFVVLTDPTWWTEAHGFGVNLSIRFTSPESDDMKLKRIGEPRWVAKITPAAVQKLFPIEAARAGVTSGLGRAECRVTAQGALVECHPLLGVPDGVGFSEAAAQAALVIRMNPWTQEGGPVDGAAVTVPIPFNLAKPALAPASAALSAKP